MKRASSWMATVVALATPASAAELTVYTTDSSNVVQNTFIAGQTIHLKVLGDTEGGTDGGGIEGYLTWNSALTSTLTAAQGDWLFDKGFLFAGDGFSAIFNQVTPAVPPVTATNPIATSVVTLVANQPGVVTVSFGGPVLDFFGIYSQDPASLGTAHSFTIVSEPEWDLGDPWIEATPVGDPGNAADPTTGLGSVGHDFRIGPHEITNAEYTWFLNAVADADPNGLYDADMGAGLGGILRSGNPGTFQYRATPGRREMPVNHVSWYDALRLANWVHNGQPNTGAQTAATTEDGAYAFSGPTSVGPRKPGAGAFLPSEDEWYKAAYYQSSSGTYFDYPAGSDTQTTCAPPTPSPNRANCNNAVASDLTPKQSYGPSPYGTFDQGGNLEEWTESEESGNRIARGGSFADAPTALSASASTGHDPQLEHAELGFRLPEPSARVQIGAALAALFVLGARKRRSSRSSSA